MSDREKAYDLVHTENPWSRDQMFALAYRLSIARGKLSMVTQDGITMVTRFRSIDTVSSLSSDVPV